MPHQQVDVSLLNLPWAAYSLVAAIADDGVPWLTLILPRLNVVDEKAMLEYGKQPWVLVVESFNRKTGLGSKMGTWLLERNFSPR